MKRKYITLPAVLGIALSAMILLGSCSNSVPAEENAASDETETITVQVSSVEKGDISTGLTYTGRVRPYEETAVIAMVAGKVETVAHDIGDEVKKGDILFELDKTDIQNNIDVLEAQLEAVQAQVRSAETSVELVNGASMQVQIMNAKAALQQAEIAYNDMKTTYANNQRLYEAGVISKSDMDKTETGLKNAEIAYNQAQKSYDLIANQMPSENLRQAQDGLAAAKASLKATQAQMESAKKTLDDATVTSPIDGTVTACNVTEGAVYSQSAGPAFMVSNMEKVYIAVSVSEQLINTLEPGQSVDVRVSTVSDDYRKGTIDKVNPAAGQTGTYDVKIVMDNADGKLKSGMFGEVRFVKDKSEDTFVLPRNAVISSGEETYVFVEENGLAKKVPVTVGVDTGEEIEVKEGLTEDMHLVTKGQEFLQDGDRVAVAGSQIEKGE